MVMFYKADGSWDRDAYNRHMLEEEYAEGYGYGEEVGEERGEKRGISIGKERGRVEERRSIIRKLFNRGMSNNEIADIMNINLEDVEKYLTKKDLSLIEKYINRDLWRKYGLYYGR